MKIANQGNLDPFKASKRSLTTTDSAGRRVRKVAPGGARGRAKMKESPGGAAQALYV
jgi:hypothetical protein